MAAAAEIQVGTGYINGIQGVITMTGAATFNMASRTFGSEFKMEEIPSQNGATIETIIASQQKRILDIEFAPKGASRADAIAVVATLTALTPLSVITIGQSGTPAIAAAAGTYNLMSGMAVRESRDGILSVTMKLQACESTTAGTFGGLTVV